MIDITHDHEVLVIVAVHHIVLHREDVVRRQHDENVLHISILHILAVVHIVKHRHVRVTEHGVVHRIVMVIVKSQFIAQHHDDVVPWHHDQHVRHIVLVK
jgi:hypothetical protein